MVIISLRPRLPRVEPGLAGLEEELIAERRPQNDDADLSSYSLKEPLRRASTRCNPKAPFMTRRSHHT